MSTNPEPGIWLHLLGNLKGSTILELMPSKKQSKQFSMWQPKQPEVEMKPEALGKEQKWKYQEKSGTEAESEALGQGPQRKCQDGTDIVFRVLHRAL